MKPDQVRKWLKFYDNGTITETEFDIHLSDICLAEKITSLKQSGNAPVIDMIGGSFGGALTHNYGMFDINSRTRAYYNFTILNVVRFFWNKTMRMLRLHRLSKVW